MTSGNSDETVFAQEPASLPGTLKRLGGSMSDDFNTILANQAIKSLFLSTDEAIRKKQSRAALATLVRIGPKDEIEGMIAAQLIACHNASMECYRRAMIHDQTFDGRHENLNQANKLSRTYATLVDALNRNRGKGQQKVTVEHVHVHQGGQAIVGNVEDRGGARPKIEEQPHAIAYAPQQAMWSTNTKREPLPISGDAERPMPNARRKISGRSER